MKIIVRMNIICFQFFSNIYINIIYWKIEKYEAYLDPFLYILKEKFELKNQPKNN